MACNIEKNISYNYLFLFIFPSWLQNRGINRMEYVGKERKYDTMPYITAFLGIAKAEKVILGVKQRKGI